MTPGLAIALTVCMAVTGISYVELLAHLERRHPNLWDELGRPRFEMMGMGNLFQPGRRFWSSLYSGRLMRLGDRRLSILALGLVVGGIGTSICGVLAYVG
jgi:hypothetical protein